MNYNNFGRGRSPAPAPHHPYGYEGPMRPMPNHREFDDPYHPANPYDGPGRPPAGRISQSPLPLAHPNQMAPPMTLNPYIDVPAHHQNYPPHYREQPPYGPPHIQPPPPSSSYRSAITHRDAFLSMGPSHPPVPPRSSSPQYKILCVTNINHKISDGPVKDALTSDFSRFGDISVSVCHDNGERLAYIYFRNYAEAREARQIKTRTLLFDKPIEIEPIYEPQTRSSPGNMSPTGGPNLPPAYSPRRRSVSPPVYPRVDPHVPLGPSRRLTPLDLPPSPQGYPTRRGSTPPECGSGPGYHHRPSPPSPMGSASIPPAYDRRGGGYPYPPAHYSSPPQDPSRPAYPTPYPSSGYIRDRDSTDRMHVSSRSPYRDPYYQAEYRSGPPPPPHHQHYPDGPPVPPASSRSRRRSRSGRRSTHGLAAPDSYRDIPVRHRYPPEPPARYMSREFRREKFGSDPYPGDHDEGRPSRVLLVNNIDATKTDLDLKEFFEPYGTIDEIEIKKVTSDCSSALVKFTSMDGAYKAKTANNGRHIGGTRCRIVYGKVSASRRLWIGGLSSSMTVPMMEDECGKYGDVVSMDYTSGRPYCYVEYETANQAQFAAFHMRSILTPASERKIRIEFVDPDRSEKFLPRQGSNSQLSDLNSSSKLRTVTETTCDANASPHSSGGLSGRKRSVSPASDLSISKRTCHQTEIPLAANTFKQERLVAAAAAAAKARTSSTTSSAASQPPTLDRSKIKTGGDTHDSNELNNNSDSNQILVSNLSDKSLGNETRLQEAPSVELLSQCSTMRDVISCCPVSWPGQIGLRNFIFPAQIYMCSGSKQTIDAYLSRPASDNGPLLQITQRWRLQPQPKLEEVKRRMQSGNLGILVIAARREKAPENRPVSSVQATVSWNRLPADTNEISGQQVALLTSDNHARDDRPTQNGPVAQENGDLDNKSQQSAATIENETPNTPADKHEDGLPKSDNFQGNKTPPVDNSIATSSVVAAAAAARPSTPNNAGTPPTSSACTQSRPLRNLISYLEQKDAAGVISLSASSGDSVGGGEQAHPATDSSEVGSASSPKLLYAFPPSDFALNLLRSYAPSLLSSAARDEFLLGVIVSGNVESGKI